MQCTIEGQSTPYNARKKPYNAPDCSPYLVPVSGIERLTEAPMGLYGGVQ